MSQTVASFVKRYRVKIPFLVDELSFGRTATRCCGPEMMLYAGVFGLILAIGLPGPIDGVDEPAQALSIFQQVESGLRGWRVGYLYGLYCYYAPGPGQRLDPQQALSLFNRLCRSGGLSRLVLADEPAARKT